MIVVLRHYDEPVTYSLRLISDMPHDVMNSDEKYDIYNNPVLYQISFPF